MKLFTSILMWVSTLLVAALHAFACVSKFMPVTDPAQLEMMASMGMTPTLSHILGVVELTTLVLFLIPRTSTVGFVLMVGYMGGVLATMLTHAQDATIIYVIFALLTVSGYLRNPELSARLLGKKISA